MRRNLVQRRGVIGAAVFLGLLLGMASSMQNPQPDRPGLPGHGDSRAKPKPDFTDVKYGPHERNVLDLWKAPSNRPTPILLFFHGGGFRQGDKSTIAALMVERLLEAGISVASANYRLSHQAPFPAPMYDGARAVQFLRYKATAWNLDPKRIVASGGVCWCRNFALDRFP